MRGRIVYKIARHANRRAALTQQFLAWVDEAPRSYADAEAWRRSCPHLSIWEDAISDGLVRFQNGSSMQGSRPRADAARARAAQTRLTTPRAAPRPSSAPIPCGLTVAGSSGTLEQTRNNNAARPAQGAGFLRVSRGLTMIEQLRQRLQALQKTAGIADGACTLPLGIAAIDGALGGGLARGALHEIAAVSEAHLAAATGFALGLAVFPLPAAGRGWRVPKARAG